MEIDITEHKKLIHHVMKKYNIKPTGIYDEDDYFQAGLIGVWIAAEKYDPSRGTTFATHAVPWIRSQMLKLTSYEKAEMRMAETVSIYKEISKTSDVPLLMVDIIPLDKDVEEKLIDRISLKERIREAMKFEPFIVKKMIEGYKHAEIGEQMGITKQRVGQRIKAMREMVKA